jgi:hypothetical protein
LWRDRDVLGMRKRDMRLGREMGDDTTEGNLEMEYGNLRMRDINPLKMAIVISNGQYHGY